MRTIPWLVILASAGLLPCLPAQQALVIPASFAQVDAPSLLGIAGVGANTRQQIVIDARHLVPLVGQSLTAMSFRREAANEPYAGGTVDVTVRLAHTLADSLSASRSFAANLGASALMVFSGTVSLPASPAPTGPTGSWAADQTCRIAFTTPFHYIGGNLVVDLQASGTASTPPWWPADAAWDGTSGSEQSVGVGAGIYANGTGEWARLSPASLVPGATAQLWARGTEQGLALLFVGAPAVPSGTILQAFIPEAMPQSRIYLPLPAQMIVTTFSEVLVPGSGGVAHYSFPVPNQPWVLGVSFGTQWLDVQQQFATSNGMNGSISTSLPGLGMCVVRGQSGAALGSVHTNQVFVTRFEHQ